MHRMVVATTCASLWIAVAFADQPVADEEVVVTERSDRMIGVADNATEGVVGKQQLEYRPLSRVGETLETVPGVIVTQHSGSGKANQYFLRGFNLDHGTDFASFVDGMPVNMPTHAHGQGYSDLNFLIPELISGIRYRKGPYYADEGDFSTAGAAHIDYRGKLDQNFAEVTLGYYDYYRGLFGGSTAFGNGNLLSAGEFELSNGPWTSPEGTHKYNGVVRYAVGDARNGWHVTGMAYSNAWNSTDQIPERAITSGLISRFGALDPTDGGRTHRYSLSAGWQQSSDTAETHASAYFIDYALNLFSNFTFFLDDPIHGDQFEQQDRRQIYGGEMHQRWFSHLWGYDTEQTVGLQLRYRPHPQKE